MKYFTFLLLLPCILAAEIQNSICSDGTQCPQGKYCCELPNGEPGCCDLTKDIENKIYFHAILPASVPDNVSMAEPNVMRAKCQGTQCGRYCIPQFKSGVCCSSPRTACPSGTKCCGHGQHWCCKIGLTCSSTKNVCLNKPISCPGTQCGSYCISQFKHGVCCPAPNTACPLGTKCCGSSRPWCCKKGSTCGSTKDVCINSNIPTTTVSSCRGTQCGSYCISEFKNGVCCPTANTACPSGTKCCGSSRPWCCKRGSTCGSTKDVCINSDIPTTTVSSCRGTQCGSYCISEFKNGVCCPTANTACPHGTKCCGSSRPWCCKRGSTCGSTQDVCINSDIPTTTVSSCQGTQCGSYCISEFKNGVCCPTANTACPLGTKCCGSSRPWCCKRGSTCGSTQDVCINSDIPTSTVSSCQGTQCESYCISEFKNGVCCSAPNTACPLGTKCCGSSRPWCCKKELTCGSTQNVCINSDIPTSTVSSCLGTQCGSYCISEFKYGVCCSTPNTACPLGTKCCGFSRPWCCKIGSTCGSTQGVCIKRDISPTVSSCGGTQCGSYCIFQFKNGVCCPTPNAACPFGTKCCGFLQPWCCKQGSTCGLKHDVCINSAVTNSTTMISVLLAVIMGIFSKYLL